MKTHIRFKGKALCGNKRAKNFVTKDGDFDALPDKEKCQNCKRASDQ